MLWQGWGVVVVEEKWCDEEGSGVRWCKDLGRTVGGRLEGDCSGIDTGGKGEGRQGEREKAAGGRREVVVEASELWRVQGSSMNCAASQTTPPTDPGEELSYSTLLGMDTIWCLPLAEEEPKNNLQRSPIGNSKRPWHARHVEGVAEGNGTTMTIVCVSLVDQPDSRIQRSSIQCVCVCMCVCVSGSRCLLVMSNPAGEAIHILFVLV
ncbi:hypothetical protein EX30DRAFT_12099 [Ascodesmis nigricans]|uniref:Uncharacterized protein n=1 Tax=Ascodesmis nigricans TaxID=341454 RepID=A0A4S2N6Z9_9PEZI|nr:hypothetical protein EX30DRAFT_12099 [Ascodesmis nigricans]